MVSVVRFLILSFIFLGLTACGGSHASNDTTADSSYMHPTIYYRPIIDKAEDKCSSNDLQDVKTPEGKTLTSICATSFKKCATQGSCLILDDGNVKSVGYGGRYQGKDTFVEVDRTECPYGRGVDDHLCLDPYFSVAADLSVYKAGDVIYVPVLYGVKLSDGQTHDGYLVIRDEGGGVKGPIRFDFFTGYLNYTDKDNSLSKLGLDDPTKSFLFWQVDSATAASVRSKRHYPSIPPKVMDAALVREAKF